MSHEFVGAGRPYATPHHVEQSSSSLARPWPRYWARMFDVAFMTLVVGVALAAFAPQSWMASLFTDTGNDIVFVLVALPVALVVDAALVSLFGNSVGKAVAGIRIRSADAGRPDFAALLRRNFSLYVKGMTLGVPFLCLLGFVAAYRRVREAGLTFWDEDAGTRVEDAGSTIGRTWLIALLFLSLSIFLRVYGEDNATLDAPELPSSELAPSELAPPEPVAVASEGPEASQAIDEADPTALAVGGEEWSTPVSGGSDDTSTGEGSYASSWALADEMPYLNSDLPKQVDEITRLVKVTSAGDALLTYHYDMRTTGGEPIFDDDLLEALRQNADHLRQSLAAHYCSAEMTVVRDRVSIQHIYRNYAGTTLVSIRLSPGDC